MEKENKDRDKAILIGGGLASFSISGFFGTVLIHGGILAFLFWFVITTPIPPYPHVQPPSVEVALDFGNNINGTGNVEAPNKGNNPTPDNTHTTSSSKPIEQSSSTITNNSEDNPSANSSKHPGKVDKIDTATPRPTVSVELASALNKFSHSKGQPGGNGNSGQEGNAGSPNGTTPGIGNGNTPGGAEYFLSGRSLLSHPIPVNVSKDQGKVVVEITVDPSGNVIKAVPGAKGSTTSSPYLFQKAKEAAMSTKFSQSKDPNTPQQQGTMTVVFVIQ
jgi:protein TonB